MIKKREKFKELTVPQKRRLSNFEKEIRKITFDISKRNEIDLIPISYCQADRKFQIIKLYVTFENNEKNLELINKINKKLPLEIQYWLAKSRIFSKIPKIIFTIDKKFDYFNRIEKVLKENSI